MMISLCAKRFAAGDIRYRMIYRLNESSVEIAAGTTGQTSGDRRRCG